MLNLESRAPSPRAPGLLALQAHGLRPWALLERLRPVKLEALTHQLRGYERLNLALRLIQQHFPAALADYADLSSTGWWEVLAHVANLVEEQSWFEVNWPALKVVS